MDFTPTKAYRSFGGVQGFYTHESAACGGTMTFAVYRPPQAKDGPRPVVFFLSGLTCTPENFVTKAGAQRLASELGVFIVCPDTSPRGAGYKGEDDNWDFGTGAGFYVDATEEPWSARYNMFTYVTEELPALIHGSFPTRGPEAQSIFGHSMGGHGAMVAALRDPNKWRSVSALSPVCAPMRCPWGERAFHGYLGDDIESWRPYDTTELLMHGTVPGSILVDQGEDDDFLASQLKPQLLEEACKAAGQDLELRRHRGYDHSYYFIASFVEDHIRHHAAALGL